MQRQDQKIVSASAREAFGELRPPFQTSKSVPPPWAQAKNMDSRPNIVLAALRAVATEWPAGSLSDEHAAQSLTIADELRALFQAASANPASTAMEQAAELLSVVPLELLSIFLSQLGTIDLARLAATCRALWCDVPAHPPPTPLPLPTGLVETELRRRAEARGLHIDPPPPEGALSWLACLLQRDFYDARRRHSPLAVGQQIHDSHSIFLDKEGRLHLARESAARLWGTTGARIPLPCPSRPRWCRGRTSA